jgi:hypothetical protein
VSSRATSWWRTRLGDVVETVAVLALPPALVMATGLFSAVRG